MGVVYLYPGVYCTEQIVTIAFLKENVVYTSINKYKQLAVFMYEIILFSSFDYIISAEAYLRNIELALYNIF